MDGFRKTNEKCNTKAYELKLMDNLGACAKVCKQTNKCKMFTAAIFGKEAICNFYDHDKEINLCKFMTMYEKLTK